MHTKSNHFSGQHSEAEGAGSALSCFRDVGQEALQHCSINIIFWSHTSNPKRKFVYSVMLVDNLLKNNAFNQRSALTGLSLSSSQNLNCMSMC